MATSIENALFTVHSQPCGLKLKFLRVPPPTEFRDFSQNTLTRSTFARVVGI